VCELIDEQGRHENRREDATPPLEGLHTHVFDVQPILLVKAIGVFDLGPVAPLSTHALGLCGSTDRDAGEQDEIAVVVGVVGDQCPKYLVCAVDSLLLVTLQTRGTSRPCPL